MLIRNVLGGATNLSPELFIRSQDIVFPCARAMEGGTATVRRGVFRQHVDVAVKQFHLQGSNERILIERQNVCVDSSHTIHCLISALSSASSRKYGHGMNCVEVNLRKYCRYMVFSFPAWTALHHLKIMMSQSLASGCQMGLPWIISESCQSPSALRLCEVVVLRTCVETDVLPTVQVHCICSFLASQQTRHSSWRYQRCKCSLIFF